MLIDLSHTIAHGIVTYPGLPGPLICDFLSREASRKLYAPGVEFHIGRIDMVANTGTYLDTPFHRYSDGQDLAQLPLEALCIRTDAFPIDSEAFRGVDVAGKAVLVETGWSRHWNTAAYLSGHPFLTESAALHLRDARAKLVGIDSLNVDDSKTNAVPSTTSCSEAASRSSNT